MPDRSNPRATSARTRGATRVALAMCWVVAAGWASGAAGQEPTSAAPSAAEGDTSQPKVFLKETVVTGARYPRAYYESPQALSFASRLQIQELVPTASGDVLSTMPGVDNSKDSPWEQRPVLRGLGGQRVMVLVDGIPMNSARGNGPHPSLVDPSQLERIEVVRGPSSVAYGSDALGGAINFLTREGPVMGERFAGAASIGAGSADGQRTGILELMPRIGRLSAFLSSGVRSADNVHAPHHEIPNSGFEDYNALANLRYSFTEQTSLKLGWQLYRGRDVGIPGLSFAFPGARQDFDFAFYNRDFAHLTLDRSYRNSWLAGSTVRAYWQQERRNFFSDQAFDWYLFSAFGVQPTVGPPTGPSDTSAVVTLQDRYLDIETYGFQTQFTSIRTERARFAVGLDAARDMTEGDNVRFRTFVDPGGSPVGPTAQRVTASVPRGDFDNYGAYGQSEWYLHPAWTLHLGARFTHYRYRTEFGIAAPSAGSQGPPPTVFEPMSVDDDALCGSAGLVWSPVRDLHLSANVSNGYRQPNAQDLFFNGAASVGFVLGNPDLEPERGVSYDLGMRWARPSLGLAANLFYTTYEDLIDALPVGPGTYQYTNVAEARIWGYEVEADWRLRPEWKLRGTLSDAIGDITSADAIQDLYGVAQDQAPLGGVPPVRGSLALRFSDRNGRIWVEPSTRWSWRTSRLALPTPGVPQLTEFKKEWMVGDLFAGARLPWGQRLVLGVRNFTNTPYRQALASVDEPGINFVGQLTTDF